MVPEALAMLVASGILRMYRYPNVAPPSTLTDPARARGPCRAAAVDLELGEDASPQERIHQMQDAG